MGFAFRLMIWVITFNLAVGITALALGVDVSGGNPLKGVQQTDQLMGSFNTTSGVPVEEASFWYRFLDVISLGFWQKIKIFLDTTILAIPNLIANSFPDAAPLEPYLDGIIFLIFIIGTFELFTGKDLTVR